MVKRKFKMPLLYTSYGLLKRWQEIIIMYLFTWVANVDELKLF
jgi:hypothetical protein